LPKVCKFEGNDVLVQKVEDSVIIFLKDKVWETFLHGLDNFTDDFMKDRRELPEMQRRKGL
jgi:antitoxin VapB